MVRARAKTLGDFATDWLETRTLKARTKIGYESMLANHIKPKLGDVPLSALNAETVRRWYSGLGSEHTTRNAHVYGLLHAICATAVSDGLLTSNPANLKGVMNPPAKRAAKILDVDDIAELANVIRPERLKCLVLISAWCGLRWGEVIELQRRDVSADASVITASRGATTGRVASCPHRNLARAEPWSSRHISALSWSTTWNITSRNKLTLNCSRQPKADAT